MNTMNELLQMTQHVSTTQAQRTVKADSGQKTGSDSDSSFDKLMKDRSEADGTKAPPEQTKIGTNVKTDTVEQSKAQEDQTDPKNETLKEVAAAMMFTSAGGHFTVKPSQVINFFDPSSILIVIGCTMAVVVASFPPKMLKAMPKHFMIMAKILVVDDAAFMRKVIKDTLSKSGYTELFEAVDGADAVEKYGEIHPDLVIMNISDALEFSIFPSLLLVTTLFRLGLNVSSTRLILSNGGYAGTVIKAFGQLITRGNIVIGILIFLIIVLMQFIVITKGAERVAEVAARFTLDAMDGTDFSGGAIDNTGRTQDYAINGEGFFGLYDPTSGEVSYTRDGSFTLSEFHRQKRTEDGSEAELDENGQPVMETVYMLSDGLGRFVLNDRGAVTEVTDPEAKQPVGVFDFTNTDGMTRTSENRYIPTGKNGQVRFGTGTVQQGALEVSNTDLAEQITKVIEAQRSFSYNLRMVTTSDELESTVNNLRS